MAILGDELDRFEIHVRYDAAEGVFIAEATPRGSPGPVAGGRGKTEEEARQRLGHALAELERLTREALAELRTLPPDAARSVRDHIVQLSGRTEGTARVAGHARLVVREAVEEHLAEHVPLNESGDDVLKHTPALRQLVTEHPLVANIVAGALGNLGADAVKFALGQFLALTTAGHITVANPATASPDAPPRAVAALVEEAPRPAPPLPALAPAPRGDRPRDSAPSGERTKRKRSKR